MDFFSSLICFTKHDAAAGRIATRDLVFPVAEALRALRLRHADASLRLRVETYLNDDIPAYFQGEPVLYLCRHVATPNIQTLRFLHLMREPGMRTVIGQDPRDIFVSHNQLKKALGKLPICTGVSHRDGCTIAQFHKLSIIDFNMANGKPLHAIYTKWGEPLVSFHNRLFGRVTKQPVVLEDDSSWVDRYNRGDLLGEYKKFLALFLVHGIMFEDYPVEDSAQEAWFVTDVLRPAVRHIEAIFGIRPLIAPLVPMGVASTALWEGYTPDVLEIVQGRMRGGAG